MEFNRRGEAIQQAVTGDAKERSKAIRAFPEIAEQIELNHLIAAGYGSLKDILELRKEYGVDWMRKLLRVRAIQEENN